MMKKLLFVLASETFRDLEYIVPRAILEQNWFDIKTISSSKKSVWRFGYIVENDFVTLEDIDVDSFVGIVFVWGTWILKYTDNCDIRSIAHNFNSKWKLIAAICAAPRVLLAYWLLDWKNVIWNDRDWEFWNMCSSFWACYSWEAKWVEVDSNIITAYWPEVAESFANEIVIYLK